MLTPESCDVFKIPFYQFAQLKKYRPDDIPQIKENYKAAWRNWQALISDVAGRLGEPFDKPHIERWCNGWQVRAHFFAFFKYRQNERSATILSVLLNRRRLTVSLDWHCYKAGRSQIDVHQYNRWLDELGSGAFDGFEIWHGDEDEYADYPTVGTLRKNGGLRLNSDEDFFTVGKHIEAGDLGKTDSAAWIADTVKALLPLYEACHR